MKRLYIENIRLTRGWNHNTEATISFYASDLAVRQEMVPTVDVRLAITSNGELFEVLDPLTSAVEYLGLSAVPADEQKAALAEYLEAMGVLEKLQRHIRQLRFLRDDGEPDVVFADTWLDGRPHVLMQVYADCVVPFDCSMLNSDPAASSAAEERLRAVATAAINRRFRPKPLTLQEHVEKMRWHLTEIERLTAEQAEK